ASRDAPDAARTNAARPAADTRTESPTGQPSPTAHTFRTPATSLIHHRSMFRSPTDRLPRRQLAHQLHHPTTSRLRRRRSSLKLKLRHRRMKLTLRLDPPRHMPRHQPLRRPRVVIENRFARLLRSEEHTSELQSREKLVCRLLLEKKNQ